MYFRFGIAVLIVGLLCYAVGWQELVSALSDLTLLDIVKLAVLSVALIWVSSVKWQLFVRAAGHEASISQLMQLYTIGYFVNSFTPSFVGGDVVRSLQLGKDLSNRRDAFVATFFERFTGLLAMTTLGLFFALAGAQATKGIEFVVILVGLGTLAIAGVCFSQTGSALAFRLASLSVERLSFLPFRPKLLSFISQLDEAFSVGRGNQLLIAKAMLWSFAYHSLAVVNTYVAAQAVGWENPSFAGLFVVVPLVLIVGMVPVTPSGLGIQEGAFLYFLKRIGGTQAQGLGVGIVLRAKTLIIALIGAFLWSALRSKSTTEKASC